MTIATVGANVSTPERSFEVAVDESRETDARMDAIDQLEAANECDRLAELVRGADVADEYRERALSGLAHPQCRSTLEALVESEEVPEAIRERAESLLEDTPESAGAGP